MAQQTISSKQEKVGKTIATLRERRGMTQGQLAKALNTSQSAVARMEKGEQNLSMDMLFRIGHVLHRSLITLGQTMNFKVVGGKKLSGTVTTNTAKNAAMSILAASLLNKGKTKLEHMPRIEEVFRMIEVLGSIGVVTKWSGSTLELTPPKRLQLDKLNKKSAKRMRSIIMLIGSLIHSHKKFTLPHPGGCKLGKRTIQPHLYALEDLGVKIKTTQEVYTVTANKLKPATVVMLEPGDTATENAIMAAAGISGKTIIKMASSNYMVQDLCYFIQKLGIRIDGIGTNTLTIHGKANIKKNMSYAIMEDPIESMFFVATAVVTNSKITIKRCPIDFLELELMHLEKMGVKHKVLKRYKGRNGATNLADIQTQPHEGLVALDDGVKPKPYPGINIDNLPFFVPIATQAKGKTLIHDWVYDNRAIYYTDMNKLGAEVELADPHRVFVYGPTKLKATEVVSPPALRPSAIILIGMLAAEGTSILRNVYSINRGYEDLVTRLRTLGADIEIMEEL